MKSIILLTMILLLPLVYGANCGDGVGACDCGDTLVADYTLPSDLLLSSNNCLSVGIDNIYLNCNGYIIQGDNTLSAIYGNFKDNFTLKNCNFINVTLAYNGSSSTHYANITHNNFTHCDKCIKLYNSDGIHVENNKFINSTYGIFFSDYPYAMTEGTLSVLSNEFHNLSNTAVYIEGVAYNNITDNYFWNITEHAIEIVASNFTKIESNNINHTGSNSIRINSLSNYEIIVRYNNVSNSGWNCIDVMGWDSQYYNNNVDHCYHNALNVNADAWDKLYSGRNLIENNTIRDSGIGCYIQNIVNTTYRYNRIYINGAVSDANLSAGFTSDGNYSPSIGPSTYGNIIENNYISGALTSAFRIATTESNDIYRNNVINNSNITLTGERYYQATQGNLTFKYINNTVINSSNLMWFNVDDPQYINISDNNINLTIRLSLNRYINYFYYGEKNVTIINQSFFQKCGGSTATYSTESGQEWEFRNCTETCTLPTDGGTFASDSLLCDANYHLPNGIRIGTFDDVDCNNALFIGDKTGDGLTANSVQGGSFSNCRVTNYNDNVALFNSNFINITNITTWNADGSNIYIGNGQYYTIDNVTSYNNPDSHGIYVDSKTASGNNYTVINNSKFYNNANAGIQINSANLNYVRYMIVENNVIYNNSGFGIQLYAPKDSLFRNNIIENNTLSALYFSRNPGGENFGANNNNITGNILDSDSTNGIIYVNNRTYNNRIFGNTYKKDYLLLDYRDDDISFSVNESNLNYIHFESGNSSPFVKVSNFMWSGSNQKYISVQNNSVQAVDLGTYNSLFNSTQATPIYENFAGSHINQTLGAGNRVIIYTYNDNDAPKITYINTSIDMLAYLYTPGILDIDCAVSGNYTVDQLTPLYGPQDAYLLTINDANYGFLRNTTLTITNCQINTLFRQTDIGVFYAEQHETELKHIAEKQMALTPGLYAILQVIISFVVATTLIITLRLDIKASIITVFIIGLINVIAFIFYSINTTLINIM